MDVNFFDLSGGVNQSTTKAELGMNSKIIYWADSQNIELYNNKGIIRQKGNALFIRLPQEEAVTKMCSMEADGNFKLIITTASGKIYIYDKNNDELTLLNKTINGLNVIITPFLRGAVVSTESDAMFYIKNNSSYDIVEYTVNDLSGNIMHPNAIVTHKGRLWCCQDSAIYYSALGTYNDFTTQNDAGYINDFHTDTADIITMKPYKDYLAIYKRDRVYLLSGSNPDDFAIIPFADKGVYAAEAVVNVDNKQFFLSNGIYALEQVGELNQIRLGSEISRNIKDEFGKFYKNLTSKSFVVHYPAKHEVWYFFPFDESGYFNKIWINDYLNHAWYKRVLPQNITTACLFDDIVVTADDSGNIYQEDFGNTFNGTPIEFMWKSAFLSLGNVFRRKLVDEFYFVLDDIMDNHFNFSIFKDYDSEYQDDKELIFSKHYTHFFWAGENTPDNSQYCWNDGQSEIPIWPVSTNVMEKAEICGSNFSIQLCVEGSSIDDNCAIIGLQFREIYNDD